MGKLEKTSKMDFSELVQKVLQEKYEASLKEMDKNEEELPLEERVIKKLVIRGGKKVRKKTSTRDKAKIVGGKEVLMKSSERLARKKAAKRRAIKLRSKQSVISRKQKKSMKKRKFIK
jgi:hypothetical protein